MHHAILHVSHTCTHDIVGGLRRQVNDVRPHMCVYIYIYIIPVTNTRPDNHNSNYLTVLLTELKYISLRNLTAVWGPKYDVYHIRWFGVILRTYIYIHIYTYIHIYIYT